MLLYNSDDIPKGYGTALTKKKNRMAVASKWKTYMYSSFPEMPRKL